MGLLLAVASIFMLFIVLSLAFILRQAGGRMDATGRMIHDWKPLTVPAILWINTAILLLSSISIEIARRQNFNEAWVMEEWLGLGRPTRAASLPWLVATILLGVSFLGGQAYEYTNMIVNDGFNITSGIYGSVFYTLTGLHGLHVTIGVLVLIGVLIRGFMGHFSSRMVLA